MAMIYALKELVAEALWLMKNYFNNHGIHAYLFAEITHILFEVILQILEN